MYYIIRKISYWFVFFFLSVWTGMFIFSQGLYCAAVLDADAVLSEFKYEAGQEITRPAPIKVKGLYLTAYSAGNPQKISEIIGLIKSTELNSVVIDLKDYSGLVLYDSKIDFVNKNGLKETRIKNLKSLVKKLKDNGVYAIARISVFQDPMLAEKKPDLAIKTKDGKLWRDKKGLAWVNPIKREVWDYVISVAKEASRAGFDEINFDYIRFPTDGDMGALAYAIGGKKRYEVMNEFYKYLSERMKNEPVYISADLFGLTTEKSGEDDMQIGQRLADAVKYFDYVCPMVYPSHYPKNYMGFKNPAEHPYEVVLNAMKAGVKQATGNRGKLRAWIQAFNMGAIYDGDKIKAQIKASDDAGADGWILWNARNVYAADGLSVVK
ncbi:MAG: putative glycoside hydrolase [Patescibacteria group bacterium]|nr:putative glycoside hydrolase [Patescibacteria group bacterium]